MSKLRKVLPRTQDQSVDTDFRGMGNDPIYQDSAPYAVLTVIWKSNTSAETLERWNQTFQLRGMICLENSHFHANTRIRGEHKLQTVRLMAALLNLLEDTPESEWPQSTLRWMSPFHQHLHQATRGTEHTEFSWASFKKTALNVKPGNLQIDHGVHATLNQAGIVIVAGKDTFNRDELQTLHRQLVSEITTNDSTTIRKVG